MKKILGPAKIWVHRNFGYFSTFFIANLNNNILKDPTPPKPPYILGPSYFSTFFIAKHNPSILRDPNPP